MRRAFIIFLALFAVTPASAQSYGEQTQPQPAYPQQQAVVTYPAPVSYPPATHMPVPTAPAPVPASQREYQPGDYGASVMTDIRQMNF